MHSFILISVLRSYGCLSIFFYPSPYSYGPIRGTLWRFNRHISLTHILLTCNTYFVCFEKIDKIKLLDYEYYFALTIMNLRFNRIICHLANVCFTPHSVNQTQHCRGSPDSNRVLRPELTESCPKYI